jgi:AraC family transcriptional regulator, regulatory protein of adaptative response / methylated-DNA-[protein]-cysteine methyltransferase
MDDSRWQAVLERKPEAEGAFYYGVKTTGVFCRPNCHSRLPQRGNVVFFNSASEALAAGFRSCKRCQPNAASYRTELDERIKNACRLLEQPESKLPLSELAGKVGMSAFHFHRLFKSRLGITPKQYQAAHRMDRFKDQLRRNGSVTTALYEAGFGGPSRAYEQVGSKLGMSPRQYQKGGEGVGISFATQRTALGWVLVAATPRGVCALQIGSNPAKLRANLTADFPRARLREHRAALRDYLRIVEGYLAAPGRGLAFPLDIQGTAFQRLVWGALQKVPAGSTASYQQIARRIGAPRAVRAVAGACAANPVALAVPCHRIVRANGALGGYRWGLETKRRLLKQEAAASANLKHPISGLEPTSARNRS